MFGWRFGGERSLSVYYDACYPLSSDKEIGLDLDLNFVNTSVVEIVLSQGYGRLSET